MDGQACPRRLATLVAMTIGVLTATAAPALANGIDLPTREARQGDEIGVTGHFWLTCCPPNTPVEHVKLFLVGGSQPDESERVLLFDVAANEEGVISTEFTVPFVAPGSYRLEACGGLPGAVACLPEGRFTVLLGPPSPSHIASPPADGDGPGWSLSVLGLLIIGAAATVAYFARRRRWIPD
jgi:hypothetical protein